MDLGRVGTASQHQLSQHLAPGEHLRRRSLYLHFAADGIVARGHQSAAAVIRDLYRAETARAVRLQRGVVAQRRDMYPQSLCRLKYGRPLFDLCKLSVNRDWYHVLSPRKQLSGKNPTSYCTRMPLNLQVSRHTLHRMQRD